MEIYSKNGKCEAKSGVYLEHQDSSTKKRDQPFCPPVPVFPSSTLPPNKGLVKWNSTPVIPHQDYTEFTFPLPRKLPDSGRCGRKAFLRPTEHILATFYGLVFLVEGAEWHILKSEHLPIYFIRVSVKNVKYPFRILVIDDESENHIRVVDFTVSYKTKTSLKEDAVCWQDREKFGAKFSNRSKAFQFYDAISRMASTLRKGKELENQNLDKMMDLEIHLPNSEIRKYSFMKSDSLRDALKLVCNKEKLDVNNHYFHHMQRTDDSLNMSLRVEDVRTDKIRLISKRESRGNSNDTLEKVSMPGSRKKNGGILSLFRRRFSRKRKESRQYSSAPSIIQYTDNVFMVERQSGDQINDEIYARDNISTISENSQSSHTSVKARKTESPQSTHARVRATKSDTTYLNSSSGTLTKTVKRKAPRPPTVIIPKPGQAVSANHAVSGTGTIGKKKTTKKRRAPSPPKIMNSLETPDKTNDGTSPKPSGVKPAIPTRPPSITSISPTSSSQAETENVVNQTPSNVARKALPVFIPPPPPESTPPPIDECETPVGPIDSELDDGSVEIPVEINGILDDTKSLDSKTSEIREDEGKPADDVTTEVEVTEVEVELDVNDNDYKTEVESVENANEKKDIQEIVDSNEQQKENNKTGEDKTEEKDTVDGDLSLKRDDERASIVKEENKTAELDENENSLNQENPKNLTPEQSQALLIKTQNPAQQDPLNLQSQQLFAMQQNQQMLSNILLQQMLQQQMQAQQRAPPNMMPMPMGGVLPVSSLHSMQLARGVNTMHHGIVPPGGTLPALPPHLNGYPTTMWPPVPPPTQPVANPPSEPKNTDDVKTTATSSTSTDSLPKEEKEEEKTTKSPPPVIEEELVNRPLFKKMLAQVSQGKIQGSPKIANQAPESETKPASPVSPTAKIPQIPTSYVASAQKNVPQAKPEENSTTPITLREAGRKSSYVDSAIGRSKIDNVIPNDVVPESPEPTTAALSIIPTNAIDEGSTATQSKLPESDIRIEKTSQHAVMATDNAKVSFIPNISPFGENSINREGPNISSSTTLTKHVPGAEKNIVNGETSVSVHQSTHVLGIDSSKPTSPTSPPSLNLADTVSVSAVVENERKSISAVVNRSPFQVNRITNASKPQTLASTTSSYTPTPGVNTPPLSSANSPTQTSSVNTPTHTSSVNSPVPTSSAYSPTPMSNVIPITIPTSSVHTPPPASSASVSLQQADRPVVKPKPHVPSPSSNARHTAPIGNEKRNSQTSNSNPISPVGLTSHKLTVEEPVLGTFKFQRTVIPPLSTRLNETQNTTGVSPSSGQLSNNYATTGRIKTNTVKPPVVAKKPRHFSDSKPPAVSPKPTYDIRQSKTLPKTKKQQHLQISLSLTPEERMQIHKSSGLTTATNVAGR